MNIYSVESRTRRYQVVERIVTRAFILAVALFQQLLVFCFLFSLFSVLANNLGDFEYRKYEIIHWTGIKIAQAETTLHNLPIQIGFWMGACVVVFLPMAIFVRSAAKIVHLQGQELRASLRRKLIFVVVFSTLATSLVDYGQRIKEFEAKVDQAVRARLAELTRNDALVLHPETDKPNQALKSKFDNTPYLQGKDDVSVSAGFGYIGVSIWPPHGAQFKDPKWVCDDLLKTIVELVHPHHCYVLTLDDDYRSFVAKYDDAPKPTK